MIMAVAAKSHLYRSRASGISAETSTTPETKALRSAATVAKNSRIPRGKAINIDSKSEFYRLRSPGTSAETPTTTKEKYLRAQRTVAMNSRTPKEKAAKIDLESELYRLRSAGTSKAIVTAPKEKTIKIDPKSEVYRLRSAGASAETATAPKEKAIKIDSKFEPYCLISTGTSAEIPTSPKEKGLRSPGIVAKNSSTPKGKTVKIESNSEVYRPRSPGTSTETPTTAIENTLRFPATVAKNSRIPKGEAIKIDTKSEVCRLTFPANSTEIPTTPKEKALRSPVAIPKNSRIPKEKSIKIDSKPEVYRLRSPGTSVETSTTPKEKALRSPGTSPVASSTPKVEASKLTSSNNSSPIERRDAAGVVLSKTDHRAKPLNNYKEECRSCDAISSMVSVNAVDDDQLEIELAVDKEYEKILLELDLLPEGLSALKQIITKSVVSMEKSESTANSDGLFHTIDGSRLSPIEEAALVLNTSNATAHPSSANVIDKEAEAMNTFGHSDHLFDSLPMIDTQQCEVENEDEEPEDLKINSILPLQLTPRQNNCRLAYQNPFQTPIWQKTTWEETDTEIDSYYKCVTSSSEDIINSDSYSPPLLENDYMEKLYFPQQKCQDLNRISSSFSLTPDLEEMELGKVDSNGASSQNFELNAPAEEFADSDISLMHCNLSGHDHGTIPPRYLHQADERDFDFTLEKSLMKLDVIFKESDELEDQQDPLYWPLNPNSYWQIEDYSDG